MSDQVYLWHDDVRKAPPCAKCGGFGRWLDPKHSKKTDVVDCPQCGGSGTEWVWARDNATAMAILETFEVAIIDLDHDLGGHDIDPDSPDAIYYKGDSEDNGMKLVDWMIRTGNIPHFVRVHSWNPAGAQRMIKALQAAGHTRVRYRPYEEPSGSKLLTTILKQDAGV